MSDRIQHLTKIIADELYRIGLGYSETVAESVAHTVIRAQATASDAEPVGYIDPAEAFLLPVKDGPVVMSNMTVFRTPQGKWTQAIYTRPSPSASGYVVANAQGDQWRMWGDTGPEWTGDVEAALQFARREDAEGFARDDEDAWLIQSITRPLPPLVNKLFATSQEVLACLDAMAVAPGLTAYELKRRNDLYDAIAAQGKGGAG